MGGAQIPGYPQKIAEGKERDPRTRINQADKTQEEISEYQRDQGKDAVVSVKDDFFSIVRAGRGMPHPIFGRGCSIILFCVQRLFLLSVFQKVGGLTIQLSAECLEGGKSNCPGLVVLED